MYIYLRGYFGSTYVRSRVLAEVTESPGYGFSVLTKAGAPPHWHVSMDWIGDNSWQCPPLRGPPAAVLLLGSGATSFKRASHRPLATEPSPTPRGCGRARGGAGACSTRVGGCSLGKSGRTRGKSGSVTLHQPEEGLQGTPRAVRTGSASPGHCRALAQTPSPSGGAPGPCQGVITALWEQDVGCSGHARNSEVCGAGR